MAANWNDLFRAILSLDSYNRGYNPGMDISGYTANQDAPPGIGNARVVASLPNPSTSFYAIAYNLSGGATVISYRGTTFPGSPDLGDILNGWTLSLGFSDASQAKMALKFYAEVKALKGSGPIDLTGHSLGGGLAGFVSDLTGAPADVFNNIPFGVAVAVQNQWSILNFLPVAITPSSATVRQFITSGEIAGDLRSINSALAFGALTSRGMPSLMAWAAVLQGVLLDNTTVSQTLNPDTFGISSTNLHSQSLMVLELYANVNNLTDWTTVGKGLGNALINDDVATALGIVKTGVVHGLRGDDGGNRLFGVIQSECEQLESRIRRYCDPRIV